LAAFSRFTARPETADLEVARIPMRSAAEAPIKTFVEATRYLDGLINRERTGDYVYSRLDLRPIEALLDALGRPQDALSIVHVAGSKGKGSTCLLAEAILGALGERVGTFTSPHLESWIERFRIGGREVDEASLVAAVERVRPAVDALREGPPETRPSFFDATTAIAFVLFAEARVDRAVIEVGLGGRLDSTNVVRPAVTCITSIELEHTDKLGSTEAAIAGEKAGILKPGVRAIVGALRPEAAEVVRQRAETVGAPAWTQGEQFDVHAVEKDAGGFDGAAVADRRVRATQSATGPQPWPDPPAQRIRFESAGWAPIEATLPALGAAAVTNAGLAIACVRALGAHSEAAIRDAARRGLAGVVLPGRIEILANDPAVLIDAAHTDRSARVVAEALTTLAPDGFDLLFSISSDKNVDAVLEALLPGACRVWLTRADALRSSDPAQLLERIRARRPDLPVEIVPDPVAAARTARAALPPRRRLCAIGSVFLAGVTRRTLGAGAPRSGSGDD
jgi:dihydrofolate synthase/folylpolyglutamate synthase